jgi:dihydroorotate dehydrogenase electron transfer subunit
VSRRAGQVEGRAEGDTPVRVTGEVLARRREGAYWLMSFSAPALADRARPGQFVEVAVEEKYSLLRRPFSIARVSRQGPAAGTVDVVFDVSGPGTEWLTRLNLHDLVDVVGPLGTAFPLPKRKVPCLLIGGGYGAAPLFYLAEELVREGLRVDMIVGAASRERILNPIEAKRASASVTFTTEDGSHGVQGRVTDVLAEVAESCRSAVVYACGPMAMLRAVSEACAELDLPVQVAVEEHMACGVGVCFTCVVPVTSKDGDVRMRRACIDGPVFNGSRIAWDQTRFDLGPPPDEDEPDDDEVEPERLTDEDLWGEQ